MCIRPWLVSQKTRAESRGTPNSRNVLYSLYQNIIIPEAKANTLPNCSQLITMSRTISGLRCQILRLFKIFKIPNSWWETSSEIRELKCTKINTTLTLKGDLHFKAFVTNLNLYCSEINVINITQNKSFNIQSQKRCGSMPITCNKKTSFKKKEKKVLWEVFHTNENAPFGFFPRLVSLCTHGCQKVCIFFTLVLAMMFDGFFATQQIHREEQAKHHLHHSY